MNALKNIVFARKAFRDARAILLSAAGLIVTIAMDNNNACCWTATSLVARRTQSSATTNSPEASIHSSIKPSSATSVSNDLRYAIAIRGIRRRKYGRQKRRIIEVPSPSTQRSPRRLVPQTAAPEVVWYGKSRFKPGTSTTTISFPPRLSVAQSAPPAARRDRYTSALLETSKT